MSDDETTATLQSMIGRTILAAEITPQLGDESNVESLYLRLDDGRTVTIGAWYGEALWAHGGFSRRV